MQHLKQTDTFKVYKLSLENFASGKWGIENDWPDEGFVSSTHTYRAMTLETIEWAADGINFFSWPKLHSQLVAKHTVESLEFFDKILH